MANVSSARSNLFLLRGDESRRGENRQNHAYAPAGLFGYSRLTGHYPGNQLNICKYLSSRRVEVRRCWVIAMDPRAETLAQGAACDSSSVTLSTL